MKFSKCLQALCTTVALTVVAVTVPLDYVSAAVPQTLASIKPQTTIESVQVVGEGAAAELIITSSATLKYTSYKAVAPVRFVVDFSQAVPVDGLGASFAGRGAIKLATVKRYDTEAGSLTRMEVELVQETEAVITPVAGKPNTLRISFPGYHPPAVVADVQQPVAAVSSAQAPVSSATTPIVTGVVARGGLVQIQVDGPVASFKTFRLNKPERVIVDLAGAKAVPDLKIVQVNAAGIATARVGSYADKVRIVLDAAQKGLPDATVEKNDAGVAISFNGSVAGQQNAASAQPSPSATVKSSSSSPALSGRAQIEAIDFQAMDTLSRVAVKVSGDFTAETPIKTAGFVSFKIVNAVLPNRLQRSFEAREFRSPVLRVTPIQVGSKKGEDTVIRVAMRSAADFTLRKEADMVYLEFSHAKLPAMDVTANSSAKAAQGTKASTTEAAVVEQQLTQSVTTGGKRVFTGRKVTLEFADADVRKIFQLLSEVSNKNFVLGDEVKGNIDLKLVGVPWDQALEVILNTKELDKREEGNIILIRGKGKFKSLLDEELEIRKAALKNEPLETKMFDVNYADLAGIVTQFNALKTDRGIITSDVRTNKVIVKDVTTALDDMGLLLKNLDVPEKQVMIEARIIEASTSFTKSLGIHWGLRTDPNIGGGLGIASMDSSFGGLTNTAPSSDGLFTVQPGAFSDIAFGTIGANVKLAMRLNAAATAGLVKIISTPKVATLNNKTAKIAQGQQIPYTSSTSDKIETKFVEAALSLEITPHINSNGTIVLKIDAKNDSPDRSTSTTTPAINKKQATTEMLLRDGETTVIGGIYVDRDTEGADGVPWLMDIPFLGHLFKSTNTEKSKSELLIFITPRILNTI